MSTVWREGWRRCPRESCGGEVRVRVKMRTGRPATRHEPAEPGGVELREVVARDDECRCIGWTDDEVRRLEAAWELELAEEQVDSDRRRRR